MARHWHKKERRRKRNTIVKREISKLVEAFDDKLKGCRHVSTTTSVLLLKNRRDALTNLGRESDLFVRATAPKCTRIGRSQKILPIECRLLAVSRVVVRQSNAFVRPWIGGAWKSG